MMRLHCNSRCIAYRRQWDESLISAAGSEPVATSELALKSTEPDSEPTPRDILAVPDCVRTRLNDDGITDDLWVTNRCNGTKRIKVVLAFHSDFACQSMRPNETWHYRWNYPGRSDKLEPC